MISRVRGTLVRHAPDRVEVMTPGGVAYEIEIPLGVYDRLPREGAEIELRTMQVVREDAVALFGFLEDRDRVLFGRLLTASGVGPRLALALLSTLAADGIVRAVAERDVATLQRVPGVGRKKAERLVLELADRLADAALALGPSPAPRAAEEATGALVALGYSATHAAAAVRRALDDDAALEGGALIKAALARVG